MPPFSTPNTRWAALQSRNPLAASSFIYSVTTTKIYCRPTCPSRLARRANIIFHNTPAEAEAAGFRACKRCRPNLREKEGDPQILAVEKACELIAKEDGEGKWSVKGLAKEVGLTESHFCRVFKKIMGVTIGEYRAKIAMRALRDGKSVMATEEEIPRNTAAKSSTFEDCPGIFAARDFPTPDRCHSGHLQDWEEFSWLRTPEDYVLDTSDSNIYSCNFTLSDGLEVATEDCFQFVDLNTFWVDGLVQDETSRNE